MKFFTSVPITSFSIERMFGQALTWFARSLRSRTAKGRYPNTLPRRNNSELSRPATEGVARFKGGAATERQGGKGVVPMGNRVREGDYRG